MRVVQIVGVPYSGSTVLGYILAATNGWFFGSEVYRLLPAYAGDRAGRRQLCAFCGEGCPYWDLDIRALLQAAADPAQVSQVYAAFAERLPEVAPFVDGTNSHERYEGSWSQSQVVAAQLPLRSAASHLYNLPERFGLAENPAFEAFRVAVADNPQQAVRRVRRVLRTVLQSYRQILDRAPDPHVTRTVDAPVQQQVGGMHTPSAPKNAGMISRRVLAS